MNELECSAFKFVHKLIDESDAMLVTSSALDPRVASSALHSRVARYANSRKLRAQGLAMHGT